MKFHNDGDRMPYHGCLLVAAFVKIVSCLAYTQKINEVTTVCSLTRSARSQIIIIIIVIYWSSIKLQKGALITRGSCAYKIYIVSICNFNFLKKVPAIHFPYTEQALY